jgi:hypothetical protein
MLPRTGLGKPILMVNQRVGALANAPENHSRKQGVVVPL